MSENESKNTKSKGEKTRENIIKVAGSVFAEKGYYTTSIDEISKALHIANGTLYRYFKSKEDLLTAIIYQSEKEIMEKLDAIQTSGHSLIDILYNIPVILYDFLFHNFDIYDLFYSVWQNEDFPFIQNSYSFHGIIINKIKQILNQYKDSLREDVDIDSLSVMIFFIFESARHNLRMYHPEKIDFKEQIKNPISIIYYGCEKK